MLKENALHWFPMRIRNSSLSRLNTMMERLNRNDDINETYAPLGFIKVSMDKMDSAPNLLNYIFVYSTFQRLVRVKSNQELFEPLRFATHPAYDEYYDRHDEILYISDKTMRDYMQVTAEANDQVVFLDNLDYACRPSQEVQITEGQFAGVVGRIKRIKGLRCVVIPIGHEFAAGVVDVPRKSLRYLTQAEVEQLEES